jgi:hypothetical protein
MRLGLWWVALAGCGEEQGKTPTPPQESATGEAPLVELIDPGEEGRYDTNGAIIFRAIAQDPDGATSALVATWTSDLDGVLDLPPAPESDGTLSGEAALSEGRHQLSLVVEDPTGLQAVVERTIVVNGVNSPPVLSSVELLPAEPVTDSTLSCEVGETTDADNDTIEMTWQWFINGAPDTRFSEATLSGDHFDKHDLISCAATPYDGRTGGAPVSSAEVEVINTPPSSPTITIEPSSPTPGDSLQCVLLSRGADRDADTVLHRISWTQDGERVDTTLLENGDNPLDTVPPGLVGAGETWRCTVVAYDGEEEGEPVLVEVEVSPG